jgi:hypothetical protein
MKPPSKPAGRAALAAVCTMILLAAAGCSVSFGTVDDSPSAESAASDSPVAAATTADASPLCTDLSTEDDVDFNDLQASLTYWGQVVADAPPEIVDQAQAVLDGFNKRADGTSAADDDNNNAINDAIGAVESWSIDNCPN